MREQYWGAQDGDRAQDTQIVWNNRLFKLVKEARTRLLTTLANPKLSLSERDALKDTNFLFTIGKEVVCERAFLFLLGKIIFNIKMEFNNIKP